MGDSLYKGLNRRSERPMVLETRKGKKPDLIVMAGAKLFGVGGQRKTLHGHGAAASPPG